MDSLKEIKDLLKTDKLIVGKDRTVKALKEGTVEKVFLAKNCDDSTTADINHYASMNNVEVVVLELPNDELGDMCKKPFSIAVMGVTKG